MADQHDFDLEVARRIVARVYGYDKPFSVKELRSFFNRPKPRQKKIEATLDALIEAGFVFRIPNRDAICSPSVLSHYDPDGTIADWTNTGAVSEWILAIETKQHRSGYAISVPSIDVQLPPQRFGRI